VTSVRVEEGFLLGPLEYRDALLLAFAANGAQVVFMDDGYYLVLQDKPGGSLLASAAVLNPGIILRKAGSSAYERVAENLPGEVGGLTPCPNPTCITNQPREKAARRFRVLVMEGRVAMQCVYCGTLIMGDDLRRMLAASLGVEVDHS